LNGFGDVFGRDLGSVFEVGDGAGDFEDAVVGAALRACWVIARSSRRSQSAEISQKVRTWRDDIWALQ